MYPNSLPQNEPTGIYINIGCLPGFALRLGRTRRDESWSGLRRGHGVHMTGVGIRAKAAWMSGGFSGNQGSQALLP